MRTLRLSLAGTVILALLGGVSGAVVAQEDVKEPASIHHSSLEEGTPADCLSAYTYCARVAPIQRILGWVEEV